MARTAAASGFRIEYGLIAAGIVWASEFGSSAAHMTVGLVGLLVVTDAASQAGDRGN